MEIEELGKIFNYFPLYHKHESESDYLTFLWDSFQSNYEKEKYQFSFIAFHMIYMSFIYFVVWRIKEIKSSDFDKAIIGFNDKYQKTFKGMTSPFTFSEIGESDIFKIFKLLDCQKEKIDDWHKSVILKK
jgi:hypothetical protein